MKISLSAPHLIPDIAASSPFLKKIILRAWSARVHKKDKLIEDYDTHGLFRHGDDFEGAYFLAPKNWQNPNEIVYIVRHSVVRLPARFLSTRRAVRQVLVWRNPVIDSDSPGEKYTTGFAHKVFFKILFTKFGALVSDTQQTDSGARFWRYSIVDALSRGLRVWFLKNGKEKVEISSEKDMHQKAHEIWGTHFNFKHVVIVIEKPKSEGSILSEKTEKNK